MTVSVTEWTLKFQGTEDLSECLMEEIKYAKSAMKTLIVAVICVSLYDFVWSITSDFFGIGFYDAVIYSIFGDLMPTFLFILFFWVFPKYNINFTGIGIIPIAIYVITMVELNLAYYKMCDVDCL